MERLPLTVLLCLALVSVLQGQLPTVDIGSVPYNPRPEPGCCQPSAEFIQAINGDSACTVQIRGCEFGCSVCSNHTGSISIGNSASDVKPVCPAETSMEEEMCCTPAQTVRRYKYCSGTWYSYEYPITCSCGPCEYLPTNNKCHLYEYDAIVVFYINHLRCQTRSAIKRRYCRGYCTSSEYNYIVVMFSPVATKIPVYRKSCQCCEANTYEVLERVPIVCTLPGWDWIWTWTTSIQIIKTCDCEWCRSKPFGVQAVEDELELNPEPVDTTAALSGLGIALSIP